MSETGKTNSSVDVTKHSVHTLVFRSLKRTHDMFLSDQSNPTPQDPESERIKKQIKAKQEYGAVLSIIEEKENSDQTNLAIDTEIDATSKLKKDPKTSLDVGGDLSYEEVNVNPNLHTSLQVANPSQALVAAGTQQLALIKRSTTIKPKWHAPWKLSRVISGHLGWVRCIAIEPGNQWFATGSNDRIIKIWDLSSGKLKLSLTGHISGVRGLAVSPRQPYLFSCGEDKQVKCWDLEYNKVIRHYHGHLSGVYALDLHPNLDVLVTGGRDSCARIWDMRTKACIHTLSGHTNTVASIQCQASNPQILTGSHDSTIRLWDIVAGKTDVTLTHHKKSIRSLLIHPSLNMFISGAPDNIKQWRLPEGKFVQNFPGHNAIINCLAINRDNVVVSGGDNGSMMFWDWRTGYNFHRYQTPVQPGSIDSEAGIFALKFDLSGSRLITGEADKTIKIFKEDDSAAEDTHPINFRPELNRKKF